MKILIGFFAFYYSLFATPDSSGWAFVERPPRAPNFEHAGDEDDPSIWVTFSKRLGAEHFMVRFPEDPIYTYFSEQEMEMSASRDGVSYRLTVLSAPTEEVLENRAKQIALQSNTLLIESSRPAINVLDLLYQQEGKWIWERFQATAHHLYIFQTTSDVLQGDGHHTFTQSIDIQ